MPRRILSLWLPRLPCERVLRRRGQTGDAAPVFALTREDGAVRRIHCLTPAASAAGLARGQSLTDARALCRELVTEPSDARAEACFLQLLARWAGRYCPWVSEDGADGLVLDITGSAHLFGGEAALVDDIIARLARAGITAQAGVGDTRGAAWALARFGPGGDGAVAQAGQMRAALAPLPVAALRLDEALCTRLARLGLRTIGDLAALPRASVTRRFGPDLLAKLDQALGALPEPVSPAPLPVQYATRMTLPEPIGLASDVMAGVKRLLHPLCEKLHANEVGARGMVLTVRRVDQAATQVELRLARPMREPERIGRLFESGVEGIDAGFGIDLLRLEAVGVEPLPVEQLHHMPVAAGDDEDALADLVTRLGNRLGLEAIQRLLPAESHIPERSAVVASAAFSAPAANWPAPAQPRPLVLFPAEPVAAPASRNPPARFRWRRMALTTARAEGPERIAPEWWLADEAWHSGVRDYWRVETREGRRLWLFHTPQAPGWFAQGEFA